MRISWRHYYASSLFWSILLASISRFTAPLALLLILISLPTKLTRAKYFLTLTLTYILVGLTVFCFVHSLSALSLLIQSVRYFLSPLIALGCYIVTQSQISRHGPEYVFRVINSSFLVCLVFFLADISLRLVTAANFSLLSLRGGAWSSKVGTLLFQDSNFHSTLSLSILALYLSILLRSRESLFFRAFTAMHHFLAVPVLSILVILVSQSFAAYITTFFLLASYFILSIFPLLSRTIWRLRSATPFLVFSIVLSLFFLVIPSFLTSSTSAVSGASKYSSLDSKIFIASKSLQLLTVDSIFLSGVGPQQFQHVGFQDRNHEAHTLLGMASETGVPMILLLSLFMGICTYRNPIFLFLQIPLLLSYTFALFPLAYLFIPLYCGLTLFAFDGLERPCL